MAYIYYVSGIWFNYQTIFSVLERLNSVVYFFLISKHGAVNEKGSYYVPIDTLLVSRHLSLVVTADLFTYWKYLYTHVFYV